MHRKLKWQIPGEPLAGRYNWCQGLVPGRGPAVEKHWRTIYTSIAPVHSSVRKFPRPIYTASLWVRVKLLSKCTPLCGNCLPALRLIAHGRFYSLPTIVLPKWNSTVVYDSAHELFNRGDYKFAACSISWATRLSLDDCVYKSKKYSDT